MCGIAGLSVGCPLRDTCQSRDWLRETKSEVSRQSTLEKTWDRRASVRNAPRRMLDPEGDSRLFPSEMIPLLAATDGRRFPQPVIDSIHTHHLYRYLNFTILLESLVVNKTILGIYFQTTGISGGTDRRIDALRMYTDEA